MHRYGRPAGGEDRSGLPSAFYTDEITLCVSLRLLFSPGGCLRILPPSAQIVALENCQRLVGPGPWAMMDMSCSRFSLLHAVLKRKSPIRPLCAGANVSPGWTPRSGVFRLKEGDACYSLIAAPWRWGGTRKWLDLACPPPPAGA